MIFEIPEAIKETLEMNGKKTDAIVSKMKDGELFYFTGCGTAFFAGMLGSQLLSFAKSAKLRSVCVPALEFQSYNYPVNNSTVAIAVSHSGITKTTLDALIYAKAKGAFSVGITHFEDRPISQVGDQTLVVGNGPDKSRCHTKCYVASAVACTLLGIKLLKQSDRPISTRLQRIENELKQLPELTSKVLNSVDEVCRTLAEEYSTISRYYFAGAGPNIPNTFEAALKNMETSFVPAQGFETEQLLHGPWMSLDKESVLVVLAPNGNCHQRNLDLVRAARTLGARVIAMVDVGDERTASQCDYAIELPVVDEYLSPILNIIPVYLFAYYTSVKREINPDLLRYLSPSYWQARQIIFPPGTH
jgi:glucosamine--fructose-6-phosphate aminotransferase (isomerizing)